MAVPWVHSNILLVSSLELETQFSSISQVLLVTMVRDSLLTNCSQNQSPAINQPPILIVRLMLNLRQLNESGSRTHSSDEQVPSRFSVPMFRSLSAFLGNVGEPLDYGQMERYVQGEETHSAADLRHVMLDDSQSTSRTSADPDIPQAGPSGI